MKRVLISLTLLLAVVAANAQYNDYTTDEKGFYGNKFFDNWYAGIGFAGGFGTTHNGFMANLNPAITLRVAKLFTPVFGLGIDGDLYFTNKHEQLKTDDNPSGNMTYGSFPRVTHIGVLAQVNLSNAIWSYYGEPRKWEFYALTGFYWGHNFGEDHPDNTKTDGNHEIVGEKLNTLNHKLALQAAYNFGKDMEWQLYFEPSLNYCIAGAEEPRVENGYYMGNKLVKYNFNASYIQLQLGINYKFMTSNGSHNFMIVEDCDPMELDDLNNTINDLRAKNAADSAKYANMQKELVDLQDALNECKSTPVVVEKKSKLPMLPAIFYGVNKSTVDQAQMPNVKVAGEILRNHGELKLHIKGYASPEGNAEGNNILGQKRADAVKNLLIKQYNISPDRIISEGCGPTDELFEIYEFNRVAMLTLEE